MSIQPAKSSDDLLPIFLEPEPHPRVQIDKLLHENPHLPIDPVLSKLIENPRLSFFAAEHVLEHLKEIVSKGKPEIKASDVKIENITRSMWMRSAL